MSTTAQNDVLARWNSLDADSASQEILPCCGSRAWATALSAQRPFGDADELLAASDAVWASLSEENWREAFDSHPRIGQQHARAATAQSLAWSSEEQRAAMGSAGAQEDATKLALAAGNLQYEERFGHIFIVCAAGRSAAEILEILNTRMHNSAVTEILEAAEQQRQITQLRLRRWLGGN